MSSNPKKDSNLPATSKTEKKMPPSFMEKEFERKRAYDVVISMEEKKYSKEICEWGMRGFASIASLAMTTQNAESMADFLDDGGCEALLNIMNKYGEDSIVIASLGCLTITVLAWSLRELKEFLGEIGACEVAVYVISVHIGDPEVSEYGSYAIGTLANNNIANSYRLSECEACDVLAQVGNFGFNLRHEKAVLVARNVCYAIAQLAEAVNAKKLMQCGASALVAHLTKLHLRNEEFAIAAVHCICALASLNPFHREELGKNNICKLIIEIINAHHEKNISLVTEGCETIMHLSLSPNNSDKLSEHGGNELILSLFSKVMMEIDFGTEICTGCLLNFATYGVNAKRNRIKLVLNNAMELLKQAQFSHKASFKARENITTLLDSLNNEISLNPELANEILSNNGSSSNHNHPHSNNPNGTSGNSGLSNSTSNSNIHGNSSSGGLARDRSSSASPNTVMNSSGNNPNQPATTHTHLVRVIHGSEMKGSTVPLQVEVREVIEYDSFHSKLNTRSESPAHSPIVNRHRGNTGIAMEDEQNTNTTSSTASTAVKHSPYIANGGTNNNNNNSNYNNSANNNYNYNNNNNNNNDQNSNLKNSFFGKILSVTTGNRSRNNSNAPMMLNGKGDSAANSNANNLPPPPKGGVFEI